MAGLSCQKASDSTEATFVLNEGRRNLGLDTARGVTILFVVAGHIFAPPWQTIIYVFHMPFFFLVGGYLYKSQDDLPLLKNRFDKLIIPYTIFLAIFSIPELINAVEHSGASDIPWRLRRLFLGGEKLKAPYTIFWFPTCFFLTVIIYNYLARRISDRNLWLASFALLIAAYTNQFMFPQLWLPWALNVCAISIPLYHFGRVFGHHIFRPSLTLMMVSAAVSLTYSALILYADAPPVGMKSAYLGIPLITLLVAICFCSALAGATRLVARFDWAIKPLVYCGAASMTIMYVHMPVQMVLSDRGLQDPWLRLLVTVMICLAAHTIFLSFRASRRLLLGQTSQ